MKWHSGAILIVALAFIPLVWAQQSSPTEPDTSGSPTIFQSLYHVEPDSSMPFELNRTVAANVAKADEDVAYQEFQSIQAKLATLIKCYPHTNAGKAAADMIDRAGLCVGPKGYEGLYPINTFFSGGAINR